MSDYIDRKAAIDATWEEPSYTDPLNILTEVRDRIEALPSAEVEPVKRGKWILKSEAPITGEKYWECSLCGCGSDSFDTVYFTPYCPNCGAKMDAPTIIGAEEGEEE